MVRRARFRGLGSPFVVLVALGMVGAWPGVAHAQSADDSWFPKPAPSEPARRTPPEEQPASPPDHEPAPAPPAVSPDPRPPAEPPVPGPASEPVYPVTFSASDRSASLMIDGGGVARPCHGACTLDLAEGSYVLRIQTFRRNWTVPVAVRGRQRVDVSVPDRDTHATGVMLTVAGGSILSLALTFAYVTVIVCSDRPDGSPPPSACEGEPFIMDSVPWVLGASGVGAVMSAIGVGMIVSTSKPSVTISAARPRRSPGTFVGVAPVGAGSGLVLKTSF